MTLLPGDGAPGDPGLIVAGGGSIVVASDALLARGDLLRRVAAEIDELRAALSRSRYLVASARAGVVGVSDAAEPWLVCADAELAGAQQACERLRAALVTALEGYGWAERVASTATRALMAQSAWAIGRLSPVLVLGGAVVGVSVAAVAVPATALGLTVAALATGRPDRVVADLFAGLPLGAVLTHKGVVALTRAGVMGTDDAVAGALHLPSPLTTVTGSAASDNGVAGTGADAAGLAGSALAAVVAGRGLGAFCDSAVAVRRTSSLSVTPATTVQDRASRIPRRDPEGSETAQVRIDRYSRTGARDRFEVYIGGTVDFGLGSSPEPWDMGSNITALAGLPAGSYTAVREAMARAGVTAESEVVLVGHSQGGLVASLVAASGNYNVRGLVTFGAPAGGVRIPAAVPTLSVRHSDDLVPALGGYDVDNRPVVISREAYADRAVPQGVAVPAHDMTEYEETARRIDEATSARVRDAVAATVDAEPARDTPAETVESTRYVAVRVPRSATSGGR